MCVCPRCWPRYDPLAMIANSGSAFFAVNCPEYPKYMGMIFHCVYRLPINLQFGLTALSKTNKSNVQMFICHLRLGAAGTKIEV